MRNRSFATRLFGLLLIGASLCGSPLSLAEEAGKQGAAEQAPPPALMSKGRDLFLGTVRLSAGGPSCNACHNVVNDAVIGGGTLATDLTDSFGRLGAADIVDTFPRKGAKSPFPLMQFAYQGREITDEEGLALVAFLQSADAQSATQKPNDLGPTMLLGGGTGVVLLLLLLSLIGRGRKRRSVNQEIYDRQVISE